MILLGSIANVIAIVIGTLLGIVFTQINEKYKETIMHGIGLTIIIIGIQMALTVNSIIIVLLSILFGAIVGESLKLDYYLNEFGNRINERFTRNNKDINISEGFVTASLIFVIGAMAILGALDSGIRGDHGILFTKSILDGFTSLVLASTLGIGVMLSAIPVFIFQSTITMLALKIDQLVPEVILSNLINEVTAIGGLLILAIGLNLLKLTQIKVINLLPSIPIVIIVIYVLEMIY